MCSVGYRLTNTLQSYPRPPVRQINRQFLVNTSDSVADLLIIRDKDTSVIIVSARNFALKL